MRIWRWLRVAWRAYRRERSRRREGDFIAWPDGHRTWVLPDGFFIDCTRSGPVQFGPVGWSPVVTARMMESGQSALARPLPPEELEAAFAAMMRAYLESGDFKRYIVSKLKFTPDIEDAAMDAIFDDEISVVSVSRIPLIFSESLCASPLARELGIKPEDLLD